MEYSTSSAVDGAETVLCRPVARLIRILLDACQHMESVVVIVFAQFSSSSVPRDLAVELRHQDGARFLGDKTASE
jgi:hypothetical protein